MNNTGVWIKDPIKEFKLKEIKTNNINYVCREQLIADGYVKGYITKEQYKLLLNKK